MDAKKLGRRIRLKGTGNPSIDRDGLHLASLEARLKKVASLLLTFRSIFILLLQESALSRADCTFLFALLRSLSAAHKEASSANRATSTSVGIISLRLLM